MTSIFGQPGLSEGRDLPSVCFFQMDEIEGAEFATVVVLTSNWNLENLEHTSLFLLIDNVSPSKLFFVN